MADGTPKKGHAPPPEVIAYFADKALVPAFSWLDVWGAEHAAAFTVAKATELEVLSAFKGSIAKALQEGKGFDRWREDVRGELTKLGWWRPRMVKDPKGTDPDRMVDFSRSRRLRIIFHSNVASARAAGQWDRAQRTKDVLPYFLYLKTTSDDPRPEHLSFVGVVLPIDHPWWTTHFPPNGWLCKCHVRQISRHEAKRRVGTKSPDGVRYVDSPPDDGPPIPHVNRRTGEITLVPPGIDPGWHFNSGIARAGVIAKKLAEAEAALDKVEASLPPLVKPKRPKRPRKTSATPSPEAVEGDVVFPATPPDPAMERLASDVVADLFRHPDELRDRRAAAEAARRTLPDGVTISLDQAVLVRWYTGAGFRTLNEALLRGKSTVRQLRQRDALNGALDRLPAFRGMVQRSIAAIAADIEADFVKGETITFGSFTSSAVPPAAPLPHRNVVLIIDSRAGRLIRWLSAKPDQNEALFQAGTTFRVLDVQRDGETMKIKLKEIEADKVKSELSTRHEDMTDEELSAAMDRMIARIRFSDDPEEYDQDFADRMQSGGPGVRVTN